MARAMKRYSALLVVSAMLGFASGTTQAAPLNITNIDGGWFNGVPGANISAVSNVVSPGTDRVRWGGTTGNINTGSGYNFAPGADLVPVTLNTTFALGVFTHINQPISQSITDIEYHFQFDTNGVPANLNDVIVFSHNETPNAPGPPASDDIVTISSVNLNSLITVGSDIYFFSLLGFSTDGGTTISNVFRSPEGGSNSATLYGIVTAQPISAVPVPASAVLLLTGVLGLAGFRKKKLA